MMKLEISLLMICYQSFENNQKVEVSTKNRENFKSKFLINCSGDSNLMTQLLFRGDEFNIFGGFVLKKYMKTQLCSGLIRMVL